MGDEYSDIDKIVHNGNQPVRGRGPAEYVDGLEQLGVQFSPGRPGRWFELDPERMTRGQQDKAYRLRAGWLAAPECRRMVAAELWRRWFVIA